MKRGICGLITLIAIIGLMGCSHVGLSKGGTEEALASKTEPGPVLMVATAENKVSSKAKVIIMGCGFKPKQEVHILFTTLDGVLSDIDDALKPKPVANEIGTWVTTWTLGGYSKIIKEEGAYTITAADSDYNFLAQVPVAFYVEKKEKKKK
jgi:hypothetical protein